MSHPRFTAREPSAALNPLQRLIAEHCANTGDSLVDVANRGGLSRQTLSTLANRAELATMPRPGTIAKLATGLGTSSRVVREVCSETVYGTANGAPHDHRLQVLVDLAGELPPAYVDVLLATARALRASEAS
jgi:hypothetical protein